MRICLPGHAYFCVSQAPENTPVLERTPLKHVLDIAHQGSILLFYTKGEVDKLGNLLSDEQRAAFNKICGTVDDFIQFTHKVTEESAYKEIADMLYEIRSVMMAEADKLKDKGGAVKFIADEIKGLADAVMRCVK